VHKDFNKGHKEVLTTEVKEYGTEEKELSIEH
jgi:hypothetical protein